MDEETAEQRLIGLIPDTLLGSARQLSQMNDGARVVLYVDPTMQLGENYLPVDALGIVADIMGRSRAW
jgi:hypothetical protein